MKLEKEKSESSWVWRLDGTIAGRRYRESFTTRKQGEEFVAELRLQARKAKHGLERDRRRVTLAELVEERISDLDITRKTDRRVKVVINEFLAKLPQGIFLDELRCADFRAYVKSCRAAGNGPETINGKLKFVSGMLGVAPTIFSALEDEGWRPPRIPWEKVSKRGKERVMSREECEQLLEALRFLGLGKEDRRLSAASIKARRDVADVLEVALNIGMRGGEVRGLTWNQVDLEAVEIHLPKTKNGEPRDIPTNRRVLEILRRRRQTFPGRWVFPNAKGDGPRSNVTRLVRKVALGLGLRYGRDIEDGFTVHTSRHTAATGLLQSGNDMKTVQDILGHSSSTMTLRYSHSTRESRRQAVESLSRSSGFSTKSRQRIGGETVTTNFRKHLKERGGDH